MVREYSDGFVNYSANKKELIISLLHFLWIYSANKKTMKNEYDNKRNPKGYNA